MKSITQIPIGWVKRLFCKKKTIFIRVYEAGGERRALYGKVLRYKGESYLYKLWWVGGKWGAYTFNVDAYLHQNGMLLHEN